MLDGILKLSLANRLAAFLLAAVIGCWGYDAYAGLTVEAFPDPTDTQVQVITLFPGQPTEEVERRVSVPLDSKNSDPMTLRTLQDWSVRPSSSRSPAARRSPARAAGATSGSA